MNLDNNNKRKLQNEDDLIILQENEEISLNKKTQYLSYTERYFKKFYKLNVRYENNDHLILMHCKRFLLFEKILDFLCCVFFFKANKVAVCSIAPSHPILELSKHKVTKIEFIQQVTDEMSGKHKHFAKNVHVDQPICKVYCDKLSEAGVVSGEVYFLICSCLNAKLIEINEKLITEPSLIQTHPFTQGYIAILMPKLTNLNEQTSELITQAEYSVQIEKLINNLNK